MPPELADYIIKYGYLTIFSLVFLQEIGAPNPVPNELVLLFSGYLSSTGHLDFSLVILTVVIADLLGTTALYAIFYFLGKYILSKNWRFISREKIDRLTDAVEKRGGLGVFIGRLIPYLRGYTSVAAGILRVKPLVYLPIVLLTALIWSGGYTLGGRLLGSRYLALNDWLSPWKVLLFGLTTFLFAVFILPKLIKKRS